MYTLALLSFLGWILFIIFAGTGLIALPYDLFNDWKYRPKPISLQVYASEKAKLRKRGEILREAGIAIKYDQLNALGRKISKKEKQEMVRTFHRFENAVYWLKKDYFHVQTAYKLRGGNPIFAWIKLLLSFVGYVCIYLHLLACV